MVSDNDGSAFITKAEYDSLKNGFQAQLDGYNTSIDAKIDNAISSYLAGIKVAKSGDRNSLREGIIWSIGPFDRPRFKHGTPIWDMMSGRIIFPNTTSSNRNETQASYISLQSSWGNNFTSKTPVVNERWGYDDIIIDNVSSNGALLDGWFGLCGHWKQIWHVTNIGTQWSDYLANVSVAAMVAVASPQAMWTNQESWYGNFRGMTTNKSGTDWDVVAWANNPGLNTNTGNGNVNYASITKGNQMKWDNNISAFGPLSYNYFTTTYENQPSIANQSFLNIANYGRDEKCYIELPSYHYDQTYNIKLNYWNLLRWILPDPDSCLTPANNPWNLSSLPSWKSQAVYGNHRWISPEAGQVATNGSMPLYVTKGYSSRWVDGPNTYDFAQHVYVQEPDLDKTIRNWNKIGLTMPIVVNNYITKNSMTSQLLTLKDGTKAMSLAAGVPTAQIEKKQKLTVKGEFRKNCSYTYNASTKTSTLNEGSKDTTDVYVVYAKYSPFNINSMPEDESDLIDISPEVKDTDNKGKLTKCRIVRDGNINIAFKNDTETEKVVFLKWEKLSNWNAARTARRTGSATNTDTHVINTRTGETIAAPTWTYFGGGFVKFDKSFKWENIED